MKGGLSVVIYTLYVQRNGGGVFFVKEVVTVRLKEQAVGAKCGVPPPYPHPLPPLSRTKRPVWRDCNFRDLL